MAKYDEAPSWAAGAIWYQIFIERFRNGNPDNDPDLGTMQGALSDEIPVTWQLTPWAHNWYGEESWTQETGLDFYRTIQMRRYGGDLQGVFDKVDYLRDLGINAVYFNPLNDSPSLHKYDARSYQHIDVTLGNDKEGDIALLKAEDPGKPESWVWTNADKMFTELIKKFHEAGIRVILDFSWNHTGTQFWAFKDVRSKGKQSLYADWYEVKSYDDPNTQENEFEYDGWVGVKSMPEIKKLKSSEKQPGRPYEGNLPDAVKAHIFAVCQKWMDPNGDGNPEDGIDGMRLDVAEHVPLGFWRDLRQFTRKINPEFYLIGENWWTKWPDELMDPEPWVKGDIFDAVMHYQWYKPVRAYINQGEDRIDLSGLYDALDSIYSKYRPSTRHAMMNLISSHDSERALSGMFNHNKYKYHSKPLEDQYYKTGKPDKLAYQKLEVLLLHQFTFCGAPHIWNGDEMGMWGADDPDNRKPLWWPDIKMDVESPLYAESGAGLDQPQFDQSLFEYFASLCSLRKEQVVLQHGSFAFNRNLIDQGIFSYTRKAGADEILVLINAEAESKSLPAEDYKNFKPIYSRNAGFDKTEVKMAPYSGLVLKKI
ncbi:MAG: glycoside hydrolase family 13 protein [Saprospiraceae bacterium]|nr:glycoside hydrolase family 13 protein [Saprospiraceae bacterium]